MYKPPGSVKHSLPVVRHPSADEARSSLLFSPIALGSGLELTSRTWVPAMVPWRASDDGFVTPDILDWYGRFAEGQPGVIVVEATGIRDVPSGPLLRIGHDRFVAGLAQLVERVKRASGDRTRLFIQLIDFLRVRRRPARDRFLREFLTVTAEHRSRLAEVAADENVAELDEGELRERLLTLDAAQLERILTDREREDLQRGARERVGDVELAHIAALPRTLPPMFASAARRAREAGFDGVELHFAHAYTMASFMSALNERTDGFGGSAEGRIRLPVEVYEAVRATVGQRFTVGCRMLCDEVVEGGSQVDDAAFHAVRLAAAGMDFLSLSTGGKFEDAATPKVGHAVYPYTGESGWECMPTVYADRRGPFGRNIAKQSRVREAVRRAGHGTPIVICGGIGGFDQAEGYLQCGAGDIIGAARQSLADPDWFAKLRTGRGEEVRRCIYTNYCEALDQRHQPVTCQLWDRLDLDAPGVTRAADGRRLFAPAWEEPSAVATTQPDVARHRE